MVKLAYNPSTQEVGQTEDELRDQQELQSEALPQNKYRNK